MMEIFVRTSFAGMHNWPDAPDHRSYLRHPHRHLFEVEATAEIDEDRGIEFHDLLAKVRKVIDMHIGEPMEDDPSIRFLGPLSCERIGRRILRKVPELSKISVSEDGELGAKVDREG